MSFAMKRRWSCGRRRIFPSWFLKVNPIQARPAIQLAARLLAQDPEQGGKFVRHLYRLFWRDGWDISDAGVLREALAELGLDPQGLIEKEQATARILDGGDEQWRETGQSGVPLLVRSDGAVLVGSAREADLDRILMTQ
jgi:predicted DsbA family dithiol-disulfide isomerase